MTVMEMMADPSDTTKTATLSETTSLEIPDHVQFIEDFEDEGADESPSVTLLDQDASLVYKLEGVGFDFWQRVKVGDTLGEIAASLAAAYDAPLDRIAEDVRGLAGSLIDAGLLAVDGAGA